MRYLPLRAVWLLALPVWLGLIASGYCWLFRYSFAEGRALAGPPTLPPSFAATDSLNRAQLLLALHPHCPCSRSTVRELAKILSRAPNASDVTVLIYQPASETDAWMEGSLLNDCRRLPCQIRPDPDGRLAASLGILTSGGTVLYDSKGLLRYRGGITKARGHEGDNAGARAVIEILRGQRQRHPTTPVFGCPIRDKSREDCP